MLIYPKMEYKNMLNYRNETIEFTGCPGCAYAEHQFSLPCGMIYENDNFTVSQDRELPIVGFSVVSPKKHIENLNELSTEERNEMFGIINNIIKISKKNNICNNYNVIFEEKQKRHFHVWIMPRHERMSKLCKNITCNMGTIFEYAKKNFRNEDTYNQIEKSVNIIRKQLTA